MSAPTLPGPLSRAEGLEIIRAQCSREDITRIEATPDGRAMLAGLVDVFVELSTKLDRSVTAQHLLSRSSDVSPPAAGPTRASIGVSLSRTGIGQQVTLPASSAACELTCKGKHRFRLTAPVTFAPGSSGPLAATVEAVVPGFASNVIAGEINAIVATANEAQGDVASVTTAGDAWYLERGAGDRFLPDYLGMYVELTVGSNAGKLARIASVLTPDSVEIECDGLIPETATATWELRDWVDLGIVVTQPTDPVVRGTDDELDARADEVDIHRQTGQTDEQLRVARLSLADVVSPVAILTLANHVLGSYGPVLMYETGASAGESDPAMGLMPFPGFIADLSPCDVMPDAMDAPAEAPPLGPPPGLMATGPDTKFFVLRWDGAGLGDPGGAASPDDIGAPVDDTDPPHWMAADVSPADGAPFDDDAIRAAITVAVNKVKAAGVQWRWYPRAFR